MRIKIEKNLMKHTLIILAALFIITGCGKNSDGKSEGTITEKIPALPELVWTSNLEEAVSKAKIENKTVLINFTGSDWCGWCIKLRDEVFSKPEFAKYSIDSLILVELDFPQRKAQDAQVKKYNRKILERYGIQGFPTILLINKEGNEIGRTGYQQGGPQAYVKHLKSLIK